jgi:hypothetical protein
MIRTYFILTVLCFNTLVAISQKLNAAKASPFTAVRWEKDEPVVQVDQEWYHLKKLAAFTKEELVDFCKKEYGFKWQKRFSEDLVEVLHGLGYRPDTEVTLQLYQNGVLKNIVGTFTTENRRRSVSYNKSAADIYVVTTYPQELTVAEAVADLRQFENILTFVSSYSRLSNFDYKAAIKKMADSIAQESRKVDIDQFTNDMARVLSEIGDRHSSVKNSSFNKEIHPSYNLRLPFGLATLHGRIVALKKNVDGDTYTYYYKSYRFIKSINETLIATLVNTYNYRDRKAPEQARLLRGSRAIQKYGELMFKNNIKCPDSVKVVFSDGKTDKAETIILTKANKEYASKLLREQYTTAETISKRNFNDLSKILSNNIGYIKIPEMYPYKDVAGLESSLVNALKSLRTTKALIIDIRNNPGGEREILQTFAGYIVRKEQSPWVANVAYLRTDTNMTGDEASMTARYLYNYHSNKLSGIDRKAIDQFKQVFKLQNIVNDADFSSPFYMVLHSGKKSYNQPIYILVNEASFSAASVFASAFTGLPNVKIVGEVTDGSSGNSKTLKLKNSNIDVTVSTMLSFQRNGKTLDGNGTQPDIFIPADEKQVLTGFDSQLNRLLKIINDKN